MTVINSKSVHSIYDNCGCAMVVMKSAITSLTNKLLHALQRIQGIVWSIGRVGKNVARISSGRLSLPTLTSIGSISDPLPVWYMNELPCQQSHSLSVESLVDRQPTQMQSLSTTGSKVSLLQSTPQDAESSLQPTQGQNQPASYQVRRWVLQSRRLNDEVALMVARPESPKPCKPKENSKMAARKQPTKHKNNLTRWDAASAWSGSVLHKKKYFVLLCGHAKSVAPSQIPSWVSRNSLK